MNDWLEYLTTGAAYLGLAVLGAMVLAGLSYCSRGCHYPWRPLQRVRSISWKGIDVVAAFAILLLIPGIVDETLQNLGFFEWLYELPADKSTRWREKLWSLTLAAPLVWGLIILGLRQVRGTRLAEMGLTPVRARTNMGWGYALWLVLTPLTLAIHLLAVEVTPVDWVDKHFVEMTAAQTLTVPEWVVLFCGTVFFAPLLEEVVFRGILLPWQVRGGWEAQATIALMALFFAALGGLREADKAFNPSPVVFVLAMLPAVFLLPYWWRRRGNPDGPALAIFTNGLFFAAIHSTVWPSPIALLVLGTTLAWVTYRTSSLVGAITIHAMFNAVSATALLLQKVV